MEEVYSEIKKVQNQKPFDFVFNKEFISTKKQSNISYWNSKFNFLRDPEFVEHYPDEDPFYRNKFSSVAVVGNSGSLLRSKFGDEIDNHEKVVRFNTASVRDYEEHVGTKTDYRFSIGTLCYKTNDETILRTYRRKVQAKRDLDEGLFTSSKHFLLTDDFINWVQDLKTTDRGRNVCSTGFLGVLFFFLVSEKIDLYGFNLPIDDKHDYHYHSRVNYVEEAHSFKEEHQLYDILDRKEENFTWVKS